MMSAENSDRSFHQRHESQDAWTEDDGVDTWAADCCHGYCQTCDYGRAQFEARTPRLRALPPREISVPASDIEIYEHVDGHRFGAIFSDLLPIDQDFMGDVWGFGRTQAEAVAHLIEWTVEQNLLYHGKHLRITLQCEGGER